MGERAFEFFIDQLAAEITRATFVQTSHLRGLVEANLANAAQYLEPVAALQNSLISELPAIEAFIDRLARSAHERPPHEGLEDARAEALAALQRIREHMEETPTSSSARLIGLT